MALNEANRRQNQKNWADQFKEDVAQRGVVNELAVGRLRQEEADRKLRTAYYNAQLAQGGAAARNTALREAVELARMGGAVDTSQFSPNEAALINAVATQANDEIGREYGLASNVAETLNRPRRTQALINALKGDVKEASKTEDARWYNPATWGRIFVGDSPSYNANVAELKTLESQLPDFTAQAQAVNPELRALLTIDPATGDYVPIVPKPRTTNKRVVVPQGSGALGPVRDDTPELLRDATAFDAPPAAPIRIKASSLAQPPQAPPPHALAIGATVQMEHADGTKSWVHPDDVNAFLRKNVGSRRAGMADGGSVVGQGTSTSDNVSARLSPGEFVLPAETMEIPGAYQLAERMRGAGLALRSARQRPLRFASGGMFPFALPGMGGGKSGGFNPLAMFMGGMPMGGGGGGMNMMMPWLSLLRQPGFFNKATGNEYRPIRFATGGMVPRYANGGWVDGSPRGTITVGGSSYAPGAAPINWKEMGGVLGGGLEASQGGGFNWGMFLMNLLKNRQGGQQKRHLIYNFDNGPMPTGAGYNFA